MKRITAAFAATAATVMYFFDRQNGKRRRQMLRDRTTGLFRRGGSHVEQFGREVAAEASELKEQATQRSEEPKEQPDDVTLAQKVQSEIFRDADVPKGQIDVNAEEGKIVLRGEVDRRELIEELVERTRAVQGVRDVESLIRVAGES